MSFSAGISSAELARFERSLGSRAAAAVTVASTVVRKITFDLIRDIMRLNPVLTGRSRAGWTAIFGELGLPAPSVGGTPDGVAAGAGESEARSHLPAVGTVSRGLRPTADDVVFAEVTNLVRYILALEFGSSRQAPQGMARVTVRRHREALPRGLRAT